MVDPTIMILLATVLVFALGAFAFLTLRRWHKARNPTPQTTPEAANDAWLRREAENARKASRHPF